MKATRRQFSREFKLEAVRQLATGCRLADVARALGVNAQVLRRCQDQVHVDPATAFPGNGRAPAEEAELQRLRREVSQLRTERDFLKKWRRSSRRRRDEVSGAADHAEPGPARSALCTPGVSRSGYYAWRQRRTSARAQFNRLLVAEMQRIHTELDRTYGSPRMHPEKEELCSCGRGQDTRGSIPAR